MWHRKAMDKEIVKAMATKFSDIFAISMLKKHWKFCRCGLTHPLSKIVQILMRHTVDEVVTTVFPQIRPSLE